MINSIFIHPGFLLIIFGILLTLIKNKYITIIIPLISFFILTLMPDGMQNTISYHTNELIFLNIDKLSKLFSYIFLLILFFTLIFSFNQSNRKEISAAFIYAGSAISVILCGDLITLFIFWEIMAIASTIIIWCGSNSSYYSGIRYLFVHLLGGSSC